MVRLTRSPRTRTGPVGSVTNTPPPAQLLGSDDFVASSSRLLKETGVREAYSSGLALTTAETHPREDRKHQCFLARGPGLLGAEQLSQL